MSFDIKNNRLYIEKFKPLDYLESKNPEKFQLVKEKYWEEFKDFRYLRNMLCHNRTSTCEPPLIVSDSLISKLDGFIKRINLLKDNIFDCYVSLKHLDYVKADIPLIDVIRDMNNKNFSYIPILDNDNVLKGVVSEKAIVRLMHSKKSIDGINVYDCKDIFASSEITPRVFLPINASASSIYSLLDGKKNQIAFVTRNGKSNEPLLGIVTVWDLLDI